MSELSGGITLRRYQERVMEAVDGYLDVLNSEQKLHDDGYAARRAWDVIKKKNAVNGKPMAEYSQMQTGDDRDLPNFCLLVPTGGGKTLLATQVIGSALKRLLPEREGGGLVLWIVPSQSIYDQTVVALRDPAHLYHRALKKASGTKIKIWEKEQVGRVSALGLRRDLNVLVLMLQSVSRQIPTWEEEAQGKRSDFLRYFRDGRVLEEHFPPTDDPEANIKLRQGFTAPNGETRRGIKNLDCLVDSDLIRTSLANLVRLCRPIVIVDEQQKAATTTARNTLSQLNPALLVQLSATPKQSNLLVRVSGKELLAEEMIKLPIAICTDGIGDWERCLEKARIKRDELEVAAEKWQRESNRHIRPIVIVQVERTSKKQQYDTRYRHSEDIYHHLVNTLHIPADQVAIKTGEKDEIQGVDLLDESCQIRWIITRDALKEGWDCPFAYLLVSLLSNSSTDALTQLVGRVLRQPYQEKTSDDKLNRCYVFARHDQTNTTLQAVKNALGDAGYETDEYVYHEREGQEPPKKVFVEARFRKECVPNYLPPIPATVLLPRFCVRAEPTGTLWKPLDWYNDLLPHIDERHFDLSAVDQWRMGDELNRARDRYALLHIDELLHELHDLPVPPEAIESDEATCAWLSIHIDLPHFSIKEKRRIVDRATCRLLSRESFLKDKLALVRYALRDNLTALIEHESDRVSKSQFDELFLQKRLGFTNSFEPCRYEVPEVMRRSVGKKLRFDDHDPAQSAMDFDAAEEFNGLEHDFAYHGDKDTDVFWWYRNVQGEFGIQGWQRRRFYPDFVVQMRMNERAAPVFLIVETKGAQLTGNADTTYKQDVASYFNKIGESTPWRKMDGWEHPDGSAVDHSFYLQILSQGDRLERAWKDAWQKMKEDAALRLRPIVQSIAIIK